MLSLSSLRTAAGIMAVEGLSALQGAQAFIAKDLTKRTQSFYALTLSVNVICTSAQTLCPPLRLDGS